MSTINFTNTGLDQLTSIILSDAGLLANKRVLSADIQAGAEAANAMNAIVIQAIRATSSANDGKLTAADVRDISHYINANFSTEWVSLHGDDASGSETGFHLVQNDGATTRLFDKNVINRVADGIYHLGFGYQDNHLINEDGDANVSLDNVAIWLNTLLANDLSSNALLGVSLDLSTTGTGLDQITDIILADEGLNHRISTSDIRAGAKAANSMNALIVEAIKATGVADDAVFTSNDVREINAYLHTNHLATWTALHGDDEAGQQETGFHLVQKDGATSRLYEKNAVNKVADGLYHLGFEIEGNRLLNEDGDQNANINNVASWLNHLLAEALLNGNLSSVGLVGQNVLVDLPNTVI